MLWFGQESLIFFAWDHPAASGGRGGDCLFYFAGDDLRRLKATASQTTHGATAHVTV
jgi:hypothetical protein